jgi:GntR family transcriptional regulator
MAERISLAQQLHDKLQDIIMSTQPGDKLLTEPQLARQLGVSRATLREAMRIFETEGLIRRHQGVGTFVVRPGQVIDAGLEVLESIETMARRQGMPVSMGALEVDHRPPSEEEANALGLAPGAQVFAITRTILVEERPAAYLVDILADHLLSEAELKSGFSGSVLDLLIQRGDPALTTSRCDIQPVAVSHGIARALAIQRGDVVLKFVSKLFAADGRVVDYSISYFLPGYFHFHVVRRIGLPAGR